jgi:hypothetical protein
MEEHAAGGDEAALGFEKVGGFGVEVGGFEEGDVRGGGGAEGDAGTLEVGGEGVFKEDHGGLDGGAEVVEEEGQEAVVGLGFDGGGAAGCDELAEEREGVGTEVGWT